MSLKLQPKKWPGKIREVTLGAGNRQPRTVGGGNGLPLHTFEADFPHRPVLALEVTDINPPRWLDIVREPWEGLLGKPADAARKAAEQYGADLIMLNLMGTHPDRGGRSPDQAAIEGEHRLDPMPGQGLAQG